MDIKEIKKQALAELKQEQFDAAVKKCKEKLKKQTIWDRVFPYKLILLKKEQ